MLQFLLSIADESDHAKIKYLYAQYHDTMIRFAKYRLHKMGMPNYAADAEDAVQNAFVKITKYIGKVDFTVEDWELRAYVLRIVSNETINVMLDYVHFNNPNTPERYVDDEDFFNQLRIKERYEEVVEAIGRMDERYSIPMLLKYKDDMKVSDIAKLLGIAEKTVYTRTERGKRMLLEALDGEVRS